MIQRVQTLYILLIVIFQSLLFFLPSLSFSSSNADISIQLTGFRLNSLDSTTEVPYIFLIVLADIICMSLVTILMFKNRMKQILFCKLLSGVIVAEIGVLVYYFIQLSGLPVSFDAGNSLGIIIPPACLILSIMAMNKIKKDEELIKSVDRIR